MELSRRSIFNILMFYQILSESTGIVFNISSYEHCIFNLFDTNNGRNKGTVDIIEQILVLNQINQLWTISEAHLPSNEKNIYFRNVAGFPILLERDMFCQPCCEVTRLFLPQPETLFWFPCVLPGKYGHHDMQKQGLQVN